MDNIKDPKERILDAAASLFAQRGYSDVGVREISVAAEVNISMISYYYNGKAGILKEIIKQFFEEVEKIIKIIIAENLDSVTSTKKIIRDLVKLISTETNLSKVALIELPLDSIEIAEVKSHYFLEMHRLIQTSIHKNSPASQDPFLKCVIGPAMFSMVISHFLFGHILKTTYEKDFDEQFYDRYSDTISTLFLRGILGVADEERQKFMKNKTGV